MEFNLPVAAREYAEIATVIGRAGTGSERSDAESAIAAVRGLFAEIGMPSTLRALGMDEDRVDWAAERALLSARLVDNNPRRLDKAGATEIFRRALSGRELG